MNMANSTADERAFPLFPALVAFCVAFSTILLQLVQTRIYSVVYWNHLVYFIISVALLGFGISGTWLSFGEGSRLARTLTLRRSVIGFVITAIASSLFVPRVGIVHGFLLRSAPQMLRLLITYAAAVLPYFFAGWTLSRIYRDFAPHVHLLYLADLTGAGVGCLAFLALIRPFGAVNCVLLTCVLVAVPALLVTAKTSEDWFSLVLVLTVLGGLFAVGDRLSRQIVPEPTKAYHLNHLNLASDDGKVVEFSEWNAISRIDVISTLKEPDRKYVYIDGDAWTPIVKCSPPFVPFDPGVTRMLGKVSPYLLRRDIASVLVIGSGGGKDVLNALRGGARRVDAVEINPTTAWLLRVKYREWAGGLLDQPGVRIHVEDGRSFVRRCGQRYDRIVINVVDTLNALSSGAYVLSENYLYTVEAMMDYISHLEPGGMLCITRWEYGAEGPRLFNTGLEALYQLRVPNPDQCVMSFWSPLATLLVSNQPFTPEEAAAVRAQVTKYAKDPGETLKFVFPLNPGEPQDESQELYARCAKVRAEGTHEAFYAAYPLNIRPVGDDSPFFFHFDRPRDLFQVFRAQSVPDLVRGHWASFTLIVLLGFTGVAVGLFMGLPLLRRGRSTMPHFSAWLLYFTCLGVGFIFVEIALMQRFALLLGHPSRSLALVLGTLLFSAGLGSYCRGALNLRLPVALGVVIAGILGAAFLYPAAVNAALGQSLWVRGLVTAALVAPLGFFMGMPFPTGIRSVSELDRDGVPWMWGVNGGATVLGSILAVIIAIWGSFTVVLAAAAASYLLALVLYRAVLTRAPKTE